MSSFAGYVAGSTGRWRQRMQGRPGDLTGASVSPSSLRQGPKSSTGSARMPLAMVTSLNTGLSTVLGSLDRGRYPSDGTANRRSSQLFGLFGDPSGAALRKKQRLRSDLESVQPARCRLCPSAWSSGIGAPIFHCRHCGLDSRDSAQVTLVTLGRMPIPCGWAWDCWKPRRFTVKRQQG